jgi:hypothetical protein
MYVEYDDPINVRAGVSIRVAQHAFVRKGIGWKIPAGDPYREIVFVDGNGDSFGESHRFEDHDDEGTLQYAGPEESPPAEAVTAIQSNTEYVVVRNGENQ